MGNEIIPLVCYLKTGDSIVLQADTGKYLSRINRGTRDPIEAAKATPDVYCEFVLTSFDDGKVALRADNGKYLSRIYWVPTKIDAIEAAKPNIDVYSQFAIHKVR